MKHPFLGCVLFALPLLAFVACGDESAVNVNNVKQIAADDEAQDDADSKDSDTPVSSEKQSSKSSSSTKSSEKSSSSAKVETSESDIVASEKDLPRCSLKREGMEVYVKDEKTLYTCEDGEWTPEKDTPKDSKKSSSSEADAAPKSSSSVIYIDVDFSSSSKKDPVVIVERPISSATIIIEPDTPTPSSSSSVVPVTGLGSCAPRSNPISKNTAVAWKFTPNPASSYKPMDFVSATYEWNFGGLTANGTGSATTSGEVTYAAAGDYTASVVVTMKDGSSEVEQCETLHVNGDPISCKCFAEGGDVTTDAGIATWTATCTSVSPITNYSWNGEDGMSTSYTYVFTEKGLKHTPILKVGNVDNTLQTVTCPEVISTDASAPDYLFKLQGDMIKNDVLEVANNGCMSIRGTWTNSMYTPRLQILCDAKSDDLYSDVTFMMTYNSKTIVNYKTSAGSGWGFSNVGGVIGQLKEGEIAFDNICVSFTGTETVSCKLSQ